MIIAKKILRKVTFIGILPLMLVILSGSLTALNDVKRVDIQKPGRIIFYCSDTPQEFSTKLSEDKKKITIILKNAAITDTLRDIPGKHQVSSIRIEPEKNNLQIRIYLNSKKGYTAIPLHYSRALQVEVFNWDNLSPAEDSYRSGLLALEDGLTDPASKYLKKAARAGHGNAAAVLGVNELRNGKLNSALDHLYIAAKDKTDIYDAYGALSQIFEEYGFLDKAGFFAEAFKVKTGLNYINRQQIPEPPTELDKLESESLVKILDDPAMNDSTLLMKPGEVKDTTGKKDGRFSNIFGEQADTAAAEDEYDENKPSSYVPSWFTDILLYAVIFIVLIAVIIGGAYYRWRKAKLKKTTDTFTDELSKSMKQESGQPQKQPEQTSKDTGSKGQLIDKSTDSEEKKQEKPPQKETDSEKHRQISKGKTDQDKLLEILSRVKEFKETDQGKEQEQNPQQEQSSKAEQINPKLELAMHLKNEQQKIKSGEIESPDETELTSDMNKLSEAAQKLGIIKEKVESNKNLEKPGTDKSTISKLRKKFSDKDSKDK